MKSVAVVASICVMFFPSLVFAKNFQEKAKQKIENASDYLKGKVDATAAGIGKVQEYFENYPWKGVVQEKASSGAVMLSELEMNGSHRAVVLNPGELVDAKVRCGLDRSKTSPLAIYQVVLGFAGVGPQTSFSKILADESDEHFYLVAPEVPGVYELRFRALEQVTAFRAFEHWRDDRGAEPDASTTIGIVIVKAY